MIAPLSALAGVVLLSAAAQVMLKRGVAGLVTDRGVWALLRSLNPYVAGAGVAMLAAPPLYFFALTRLDLGFAFVSTALTQVLVLLGGSLFLREKIGLLHVMGVVLVLAGLLVWNL